MSLFNWNKRKIKTSITSDIPAKQLYEDLIRNDITPFLKILQYRRNGHTFIKKRDDEVYTVINFQGSKWNDAEYEQEFYMNVAIISPSIYRVEWGEETSFKEYDGVISFRAEFFVDTFPGSIKIRKGTDIAPIKDRVVDCVERIEQEVFARFNSLDDIRRYLDDKINIKSIQPGGGLPFRRLFYIAIIDGLQGRTIRAEAGFRSYVALHMKRKDISQLAKRSIMRTCTIQAQSVGCRLNFSELDNESIISITFAVSRRVPVGDEHKSIQRFQSLLAKLEYDKQLGYSEFYGSRAKQREVTFWFYTESPGEVMRLLERLADKVVIRPTIHMANERTE